MNVIRFFFTVACLFSPVIAFSSISVTTINIIHDRAPVMQSGALDALSVKLNIGLDNDTVFELQPKDNVYYIGANTLFDQIKVKADTNNNVILNSFTDDDNDEIIALDLISLSYR